MKFSEIHLDQNYYMNIIASLLNDVACHVYIDTNILSQLFKLNRPARTEFFNWAGQIGDRFHIPNWVVMEYNKRVNSQTLSEFVIELTKAKGYVSELDRCLRFLRGYVDEEELHGTEYHDNRTGLLDDLLHVKNSYEKIVNAANNNKTEHIRSVQDEINANLMTHILDTDIYKIIRKLYFEYQVRMEQSVPPGFRDEFKANNTLGDLIIWKEILNHCKKEHVEKAVFITRDVKPDMAYTPLFQEVDGHPARQDERMKRAHESLVYEFNIATGSSDFYLIDFYTLVKIIANRYPELAFSFQLVSHEHTETENIEDETLTAAAAPELGDEVIVHREIQNANIVSYSDYALSDTDFETHCHNDLLLNCITRFRTHNWYVQNDAVDDLRDLLTMLWGDTQDNKDAFFVIGRNLLQSADGNAFEAVHFIRHMQTAMVDKPEHLQRALADGCLYEVFFDSRGNVRRKSFKAKYFFEVMRNVTDIIPEHPFDFINGQLNNVHDRFVPRVGSNDNYLFTFTFAEPVNDIDHYHTLSLSINGTDASESFTREGGWHFADEDELAGRLSSYYAVPEDLIQTEGVPEGIGTIHFISEE